MIEHRSGLSLGENTCIVGVPIKSRVCSQLTIWHSYGAERVRGGEVSCLV